MFRNNVLSETVDWDGNTTYFKYTDDQITSITQKNKNGTEITLATLVYDDNVLTTVTDAAGNVYTLGYTDGNLTSIKKNDTVLAQYSYNGHRVTKMTDVESGYAVNFTYDSQGRIAGYSESVGDAAGAAVTVSYPGMGHTVYQDHGPDRIYDTFDECNLYYLPSRYYDPSIGRFLNADSYATTGQGFLGNNMFAYCLNDPVNMVNIAGKYPVYIVEKVETKKDGAVYTTTITYMQYDSDNLTSYLYAPTVVIEFKYTISDDGVIRMSNPDNPLLAYCRKHSHGSKNGELAGIVWECSLGTQILF